MDFIKIEEELPLFKEYAWDFKENKFIYENGKIKVLKGLEGLKVWIYKVLTTPRYRYKAYTTDFGHELDELVGKTLSSAVVESESHRYIKECLLINPYITEVNDTKVSIEGDKVHLYSRINTIYGEVEISV